MSREHYDVIIIGTGAGGGTLAHRLAPSGKRILLLERGGYLPREPENWDSKEVFGKSRYVTQEQWYDKNGEAFRPHAQYYVGGNTKFYGAILFRLRERDFGEVRHYGGVSPAWPIDYADLEPYYAEAERLYLVHGAGGRGPDRAAALRPLPVPGRLARAAHPAAARRPRADRPQPVPPAGRRGPERVGPGAGPVRALRPLRRLPLPHRREGRRARALRPSGAEHQRHARDALQGDATGDRRLRGEVTGVVVDRGGATETYSADVVVVSCGAAESPALLLRSANERIRTAWPTPPTRSAVTTWPTSTRA